MLNTKTLWLARTGGVAMASSAAAAAGTAYNDDSILQALRRLPPEELIKHMLETEEWAERLSAQSGAPTPFPRAL